MHRYLYLLRHAQSADKQISQSDIERILTPSGLMHTKAVGNFLKEKSIIPEIILSSSAVRAITTTQTIAEIINYEMSNIIVKADLYEANTSVYLKIISSIEKNIKNVMMVGHNPTISLLIDHLTGERNKSLDTSELAIIKFELGSWAKISRTIGKLEERYASND